MALSLSVPEIPVTRGLLLVVGDKQRVPEDPPVPRQSLEQKWATLKMTLQDGEPCEEEENVKEDSAPRKVEEDAQRGVLLTKQNSLSTFPRTKNEDSRSWGYWCP